MCFHFVINFEVMCVFLARKNTLRIVGLNEQCALSCESREKGRRGRRKRERFKLDFQK